MNTLLLHLPCLGHFLVGFFFFFFGVWNAYHWQPTLEAMQQKKIPGATFLLFFGITLQTLCGLLLIFGFYIKIAALALIPFTIASVLIFHPFWHFEGEIRRLNMLCFITNLTSSLGALVLLMNTIHPNLTMANFLH